MQKKDLYKIIGKNIQNQRLIQGYTQETFAELMGVSWSYVSDILDLSKIEAGILNLSLGKILEIADYLNIEVDLLLNTKS